MTRSKYNVRTHKAGKVPESGVLRACLDLLAAEKIWHRRWNTGAVKADGRFFRFGQKGDADILALPWGDMLSVESRGILPLWIECKSSTGKQTQAQVQFEQEVILEGHGYILARSSDDLKNWLIEHGVIKP